MSDNDLKNNTYLLQDEERDPLLHSFSHLKEVLNSITGKFSHVCKIIYLGKKDVFDLLQGWKNFFLKRTIAGMDRLFL